MHVLVVVLSTMFQTIALVMVAMMLYCNGDGNGDVLPHVCPLPIRCCACCQRNGWGCDACGVHYAVGCSPTKDSHVLQKHLGIPSFVFQ